MESNCGHYTSQSGLMGIIGREKIWATNIKFLNDEHEFQDALNLIAEIIGRSKKITPGHRDYAVYENFIERVNRKLRGLDSFSTESIFTFSLSEETDLLSQWRGYCAENNGYCVVFDVNELYKKIRAAYGDVYLVECVYEKENKESKLKDLLNAAWARYVALDDDKERKGVTNDLGDDVMLLASHFKDPSFSEEKERRIVVFSRHDPTRCKFREGRFSIIPYMELPAPKEFIKRIVIGPTSNAHLSHRALMMFLDKVFDFPTQFLKEGPAIELSETPYRPW